MKTSVFFTQLLLDGIAPRRKEYALYDARCRGLALRVQPGGAKSWVVWIRHHQNTRRITLGTYEALTLEDARHQARACLNGAPPRPARPAQTSLTFKDLADRFLTAKQPVYAAETLQAATSYLKTQLVPAFGTLQITRITTADVAQWFHEYSRTRPGGANQALGYFTTLMHFAKDARLLAADWPNPATPLRRNRCKARGQFLNAAQLTSLAEVLNAAPPGKRNAVDIIRAIILTGCRSGEIYRLKWSEVKADRLELDRTKTGPRTVMLNAQAIRLFKSRPKTVFDTFVFPSPFNPDRPYKTIGCSWGRFKKQAGLPENLRLHDLRHTYASHAIMTGESLAMTGRLLGHKRAASTEIYIHLDAPYLAKAADQVSTEIERLMAGG